MAGVIPKKSASGRKQWSLHGAQKSSLKRLRSQLASDGCPESQVVLAKQLLDEECEYKSEQKENARLGVYWLIKASEQGNLEATALLKTCLQTGKGISEHNYLDVKSCISMTQDEKIVRRAAKEVFAHLSNGEDYITSNQLQKKILAIDRGSSCSKSTETSDPNNECGDVNGEIMNHLDESSDSGDDTDWSQKSDTTNEKLTEDNVVSAAVTFSHGHLPIVNNILCLAEPNLKALDDIPFIYWSILHPVLSLKILYFKLIKFLGSKSIPLPLVRTDVQLILLFLFYSLVSFKDITYFLPTVIFYSSFVLMVVTTFQMLQTQRELHDFRLWRGLFICYSNGDLNEDSFETRFIINHTKPYAWFFFSLLIHYFSYSITPVKLESEFAIIACCFMFITLFGFMPKRRSKMVIDTLVLLSFAINILARYPYETDPIVSRGWRYLELKFPSFPSYVVGNGIEFCISFRLVLYALIPVILARLAMKEKWRGSYKIVLPHLVTLSWLQYFALCSHNATMYGLYRATLALVGSVLFLPLVGLMSVILPVAAVTKWIVTSNFIYTIALFLFLLTICLAVCYICARTKYAQYTASVQVILMVLAFFALLKSSEHNGNISNNFEMEIKPKELEWEIFQQLCHRRHWEGTENMASAQARCADLEGSQVFWEGTVSHVKLLSVTNNYKTLLDKFPKFIAEHFYCVYGKTTKSVCDQEDSHRITDYSVLQQSPDKCTLKEYNLYTFEMKLKMPSSFWSLTPEVYLHLTDEFKNFTLRIKSKDQIWFKGVLFNNQSAGPDGILGALSTHVKAKEIGCISCSDHELSSVKAYKSEGFNVDFVFKMYNALKFVLNVMFNPVLIFK